MLDCVWARCLDDGGPCCHRDRVQINELHEPERGVTVRGTMSALPVKADVHVSVPEWHSNNRQLSATAAQERADSTVVRQESRSLRNVTNCMTVWDESDTSRRLSDRIWDVARWKEALDTCARKTDEEMDALTLCKEQTEQALAALAVPLDVNTECMALRAARRGYELVDDPVDDELYKELKLIGRVQQELQKCIDRAFEQLCVLQEARHHLTSDLQNKMDALDIDSLCLSLTIESPEITLKPDPTRIPPGSCTPQEWFQFSQYNVANARDAMQVSLQLREEINLTRAQLQNELETQWRSTNFALRKRNHQEEQAHDELNWQIRTTEDEMMEMENDIRRLDADLQAKTWNMKLAHTRLDNRTYRPGMDLCRDEVQRGLVHEVHQLEAMIIALKQKLSEAQLTLQKMKLHHARMLENLSRKTEALTLEQRSTDKRTNLLTAAASSKSVVLPVPLANSSGRSLLELRDN